MVINFSERLVSSSNLRCSEVLIMPCELLDPERSPQAFKIVRTRPGAATSGRTPPVLSPQVVLVCGTRRAGSRESVRDR